MKTEIIRENISDIAERDSFIYLRGGQTIHVKPPCGCLLDEPNSKLESATLFIEEGDGHDIIIDVSEISAISFAIISRNRR